MRDAGRLDLRAQRHARTRDDIREAAMRLFASHGFEATTVAEISAASGISQRTFFRHYAAKEDVVIDAPLDGPEPLVQALRSRPAGEDPWATLVAVLRSRLEFWRDRPEFTAEVFGLLAESPALRARLRHKMHGWRDELAEALVDRLDHSRLEADALAAAAIGCLDAAITEWHRDTSQALEGLFESALRAVRDSGSGRSARR